MTVPSLYIRDNGLRLVAMSLVGALLISLAIPSITLAAPRQLTNQDRTVTASETRSALANTPGILEASDQIQTSSDSDSAIKAVTAGATVDIPKDPKQPVALSSQGNSIAISLPNTANAASAQKIANGVVSYGSPSGAANSVQTTEDGSLRMLTTIDNPNAPTKYSYGVSVPLGGKVSLSNDGGAIVLDARGVPIASVDKPWAKDATGKALRTWFSTDGKALTQHIHHNVPGVTYPVTADPWWNPLSWFSGFRWVNGAKVVAKRIGPWSGAFCAVGAGWAWYRSDGNGWVRVGDAVSGCLL